MLEPRIQKLLMTFIANMIDNLTEKLPTNSQKHKTKQKQDILRFLKSSNHFEFITNKKLFAKQERLFFDRTRETNKASHQCNSVKPRDVIM